MHQQRVNAALASLDWLAAERSTKIDRASLSATDLAFLSDLPMTARRNFDQSAITIPQARRLHQILNEATGQCAPRSANMTMTFRIIDFGSRLALHQVTFHGDEPVGRSDKPWSFEEPSECTAADIVAELRDALKGARLPILKAADHEHLR